MTNQMHYKGYYGSIEASVEDNCLFGKLQFIRALVSYEGQTVAELETAFKEAVEDYLDNCQRLKQSPEVPCKGSFNVRVGHDLHLAAALSATRQKLTLNDLTRQALSEYLLRHA
ncbi:type II toxin-antitoxin system HicB family antitoxin [Pseudomonas gingeri NCPPB 3146 = LMG 5327]|uniref:Type II toxin-antitoxin system HicB family antitoxin n=3 Tax=Pseudomonas TaxID=286 RepID=A0A7Y7YBZ9_9PSED|nr:type II toxin-antitoxin system HicB family antitoxin [Pseudomonas gingeri]NVZ24859.1 type II toxin-antitoxin system HicB family antitoxin [Pseudomonas gingeri]NVZ66352.1 type II toxin-antitoxin system HicB family antitoxin [Pseudomonas gingeri]NVZ76715.1 type II toxin-antitoxin system HicB family antitoxin [Pseudomonas gingeri]NVZ99430.1 type II toxin-antitoxin system HicB family antitoxin [Pseudomonas gingeri]NWA05533.1 type II toxin-antitoxin system HicB family antitoxin [Pseudomonas ging